MFMNTVVKVMYLEPVDIIFINHHNAR